MLPADYERFGLSAETADAWVTTASALMEAHCRRPTLAAASYTERTRLTARAQTARLSYGPLLAGAVTAVRVRYSRGRRGDGFDPGFGSGLDANAAMGLQVATAFGLPGTWSTLDPATLDVYAATREVGFPSTWMGLGYNEAEITYTAGFVTVPDQIKTACAQIVRNAEATPALNVKGSRIDTMQMQYFAPTLIDEGVRNLLQPFVAERL